MHQLKTAYTVYFNRRHQLVGHLFQGRFKSTVIEAESYLLEVSRYLHLNPVRGVALGQRTPTERRERLRGYLWNSYPGYAGLEKTKPFLDSEAIQGVFESSSGQRWKAWKYRRWVEEALVGEIENPFEAVKCQQVLGGKGFLGKLKDHWNQRGAQPKSYVPKRNWSASVGAQEILNRVSEHFESNPEALKERGTPNHLARGCVIALCWGHAVLSHGEIAKLQHYSVCPAAIRSRKRFEDRRSKTLGLLRSLKSGKS